MIHLTTPWALVLLVLLPATAIAGYRRLQRLPGRRGMVALAARLLVLGLLICALAGPEWLVRESRVSVVFLVDASASVGTAGQHAGMDWAARAARSAGRNDEAAMVLFGAAPRLAVPLAHYTTLPDPSAAATGATDIGSALNLGMAVLPPDQVGRLVLLSDGQDTQGRVDSALAVALARHLPIDTVAIAPPRRFDVSVRSFDAPATARVGGAIPLHIVLHSTAPVTATLQIWLDDATAQLTIPLQAGDTPLHFDQQLDKPGLHTFRVSVSAPGDAVPQNNTLDAATLAGPAGRVLLAVDDPAAATQLATTLARAHLSVVPILPSSLPANPSAYRGYDAVVLDNVPATALSRAQEKALRDAVYNTGLGLVTVGGDRSYGNGNYARTPLEDALPVLSVSTPRRVSAPIALMLVIDKSGSMSDPVNGVAKIDMVKVAAKSALDKLNVGDAVGVLAFDDTNHVIVPFHVLQGEADKARIRQQIDTLGADGDTYIYPALQQAERNVLQIPTTYRHIVLLTDGQGEDAPFDALVRRMHREHITLSTIGVGEDVVREELQRWARLGGGLFHYVSDPHAIPRIVVEEARYGTTGSAEKHGHIHLNVAAASPLLRALAGRKLPDVSVYDATTPKVNAQVIAQSASTGDPILAAWQYGLGRAVAWTSGDSADWAGAWNAGSLSSFWNDLTHWAMRGYTPAGPLPALRVEGTRLQISTVLHTSSGAFDDTADPHVRVVAPDGSAQVVTLSLSGPGSYATSIPLSGPGVYSASFAGNDHGARVSRDEASLVVPYPAEYDDDGVNSALLSHLAEATGGRALVHPADAFAHAGLPLTTTWFPLWPLLVILALLLFPIDVGLRLLLPPDATYRAAR